MTKRPVLHRRARLATSALAVAVACLLAPLAQAAKWQVNRVNHMVLTPPGGVTVREMSGVTYVGPAAGGNHRFIVAEQTKGELLQFDLSFNASGGITAIANISTIDVVAAPDYEGIAYTNAARNSVFLSDENIPTVREVSLANGVTLQGLTIPTVFTNRQPNRGFESLTRSPDATVMWTANEQALTVDGPESTPSAGTTVRLLKLNVAGNSVTAGQQFAYVVDPIHGSSTLGSPQSGLSDLVYLPDGTLISLERSVAVTTPIYRSRVYEIDFTSATDVSVGGPAAGLIGQTYTPVAKDLLWSGAADNASGQNLEGLTLGPKLANGSWVLVGVVDDGNNGTTDNDPLSLNTLVAFTATANPSADFDADGDVDGADFLRWQRGLGKPIGAAHGEGDADRDGDVDDADLTLWKAAMPAAGIATGEVAAATVPEPATTAIPPLAGLAALRRYRKHPQRQ